MTTNPIKAELEPYNIKKFDQHTDGTIYKSITINNLKDIQTWQFVSKYRLLEFCFSANEINFIKFNHDFSEVKIEQNEVDYFNTNEQGKLIYKEGINEKKEQARNYVPHTVNTSTSLIGPFDKITSISVSIGQEGKPVVINKGPNKFNINYINDNILSAIPKPNILLTKSENINTDAMSLSLNCKLKDDNKECSEQIDLIDINKKSIQENVKIEIKYERIQSLEEYNRYYKTENPDIVAYHENFEKEQLVRDLYWPLINDKHFFNYDIKNYPYDFTSDTFQKEGKNFYDNIKKYFGYYKFGVIKFEKKSEDRKNSDPIIDRKKKNNLFYVGPQKVRETLDGCSLQIDKLINESVSAFETNLGLKKDMELWKSIFFLYKPKGGQAFEEYVPKESILLLNNNDFTLNSNFKFTIELLEPINAVLSCLKNIGIKSDSNVINIEEINNKFKGFIKNYIYNEDNIKTLLSKSVTNQKFTYKKKQFTKEYLQLQKAYLFKAKPKNISLLNNLLSVYSQLLTITSKLIIEQHNRDEEIRTKFIGTYKKQQDTIIKEFNSLNQNGGSSNSPNKKGGSSNSPNNISDINKIYDICYNLRSKDKKEGSEKAQFSLCDKKIFKTRLYQLYEQKKKYTYLIKKNEAYYDQSVSSKIDPEDINDLQDIDEKDETIVTDVTDDPDDSDDSNDPNKSNSEGTTNEQEKLESTVTTISLLNKEEKDLFLKKMVELGKEKGIIIESNLLSDLDIPKFTQDEIDSIPTDSFIGDDEEDFDIEGDGGDEFDLDPNSTTSNSGDGDDPDGDDPEGDDPGGEMRAEFYNKVTESNTNSDDGNEIPQYEELGKLIGGSSISNYENVKNITGGYSQSGGLGDDQINKLKSLYKRIQEKTDNTIEYLIFRDIIYKSYNAVLAAEKNQNPKKKEIIKILEEKKTFYKVPESVTNLSKINDEDKQAFEKILNSLKDKKNEETKINKLLEKLTSEDEKLKYIIQQKKESGELIDDTLKGLIENNGLTPPKYNDMKTKINLFNTDITAIEKGLKNYNIIKQNTDLMEIYEKLDEFYILLEQLGVKKEDIKAQLDGKKNVKDSNFYPYKIAKEIMENNSPRTPLTLADFESVKDLKTPGNIKEIKDGITKDLRDLTEEILGACRVIVKYRDYKIGDGDVTERGNKIIKKHSQTPKYSFMESEEYIKFDDTIFPSGGIESSKYKLFGPFSAVYNENQNTKDLFENSFIKDDLLGSVQHGGSLVMFGFGFSGSGKTYQLISPDNKDTAGKESHILALCLKNLINVNNISLKVSELYPLVNGDVRKVENIVEQPYLTTKKQLGYDPDELKPLAKDDFLEAFGKFNKKITDIRTNKMRITPTPNNPESSRSHIFYKFIINYDDRTTGNIVIVDMAGTENTIEIKKNFLNVKASDKTEQQYKDRIDQIEQKIFTAVTGDDFSEVRETGNRIQLFRPSTTEPSTVTGLLFKKIPKPYSSLSYRKSKSDALPNLRPAKNNNKGEAASVKFFSSCIPGIPADKTAAHGSVSSLFRYDKVEGIDGRVTYPLNIITSGTNDKGYSTFISYFNFSANENKKKHEPPEVLKTTRTELGLNEVPDTIKIENSFYIAHKGLYSTLKEFSKILFNRNYDDPDNTADTRIYILTFNYVPYLELMDEKMFHFYKKLQSVTIKEQETRQENTYMKNSINDDYVTEILKTLYKEFLLCKDFEEENTGQKKNKEEEREKKYNLLEWLDEEALEAVCTADNIKNIINNGEHFNLDGGKEKFSKSINNGEIDSLIVTNSGKKINYLNPIQIFMVIIFKYYYNYVIKNQTPLINLEVQDSKKKVQPFHNIALRILLLSFMMKYINLVVNQGQGIVATLEHLKFFFLSKSSKAPTDIDSLKGLFGEHEEFDLKKYVGMPKSMITYDIKNKAKKRMLGDTSVLEKDSNTQNTIQVNKNPRKENWTYEHIDTIEGKNTIIMKELRQRGFMEQFKTIEILTDLSRTQQKATSGEQPQTIFVEDDEKNYPAGAPKLTQSAQNNKFLMLAAILRTKEDEQETIKLAKATYDTLELAQNLASEPEPNKTELNTIYCNDTKIQEDKDDYFCEDINDKKGGYKSSLNLTKYMRVNLKKSIKKKRSLKASKKRNNKSNNKSNKRKKSKHRKVRKIKA